jgi:hypothetical protein
MRVGWLDGLLKPALDFQGWAFAWLPSLPALCVSGIFVFFSSRFHMISPQRS